MTSLEYHAFNRNQAYSILATSLPDLTISAGYMAFNKLFALFNKGSSKFREVLPVKVPESDVIFSDLNIGYFLFRSN